MPMRAAGIPDVRGDRLDVVGFLRGGGHQETVGILAEQMPPVRIGDGGADLPEAMHISATAMAVPPVEMSWMTGSPAAANWRAEAIAAFAMVGSAGDGRPPDMGESDLLEGRAGQVDRPFRAEEPKVHPVFDPVEAGRE